MVRVPPRTFRSSSTSRNTRRHLELPDARGTEQTSTEVGVTPIPSHPPRLFPSSLRRPVEPRITYFTHGGKRREEVRSGEFTRRNPDGSLARLLCYSCPPTSLPVVERRVLPTGRSGPSVRLVCTGTSIHHPTTRFDLGRGAPLRLRVLTRTSVPTPRTTLLTHSFSNSPSSLCLRDSHGIPVTCNTGT